MGLSGRFAEAEGLAERSVSILDKVAGPNAQAILRPLQTLALARLEQGKFGMARSAFKRMQLIPATRPESRARVHGIAAIISEKEGKYTEAESEYVESLSAFEQAGRRNSGDSASNLMGLGSLYIKSGRLDEAARVLDGALAILDVASDTVPMDRLKLLNLRSVLDAREGEWQKAKDRLQRAISIAEHETALEPTFHSMLLANYAQALRKVHQRSEARSVEARAAALRCYRPAEGLVDVTELSAISEATKK
jgi:tetratricopeptide (TPR) repeat protein